MGLFLVQSVSDRETLIQRKLALKTQELADPGALVIKLNSTTSCFHLMLLNELSFFAMLCVVTPLI